MYTSILIKVPFLILVCWALPTFSQDLLANGSFEEENICTEFKVNCAPEAWIISDDGFENYYNEPARAYDGAHFMRIAIGNPAKPFNRTFLRTQFMCPLLKGNKYRLQFYIIGLHKILDSVGVYFGSTEPLLERKPIHLLSPSLYIADQSQGFTSDGGWQKVSLDYTALGNETFLTIANFSRRDIGRTSGIIIASHFFIFVDQFSLLPLDPNEKLCPDWEKKREEIYDQNERHEYLRRTIKYNATNKPVPFVRPGSTRAPVTGQVVSLVLPDILFDVNDRNLKASSLPLLDSFCRSLAGRNLDSLVIEGHTDHTGSPAINEPLSRGRSEATASYLKFCAHLFRVPVIVRGWSDKRPRSNEKTAEGRQLNRRVELFVYFHK